MGHLGGLRGYGRTSQSGVLQGPFVGDPTSFQAERDVPLGRAWHPLVVECLGRCVDEDGERELYVASVPSFNEWRCLVSEPAWAAVVEEPGAGFALFLACDATELNAELIEEFASYCIGRGLFWVSTWGPDCERVHDIFDRVDIAQDTEPGIVMSTWHDDEPLDEALLLFWHAFPAEGKLGGPARIGISVGSQDWTEKMQQSARDFLRVGEEPDR